MQARDRSGTYTNQRNCLALLRHGQIWFSTECIFVRQAVAEKFQTLLAEAGPSMEAAVQKSLKRSRSTPTRYCRTPKPTEALIGRRRPARSSCGDEAHDRPEPAEQNRRRGGLRSFCLAVRGRGRRRSYCSREQVGLQSRRYHSQPDHGEVATDG